MRWRKPDGGGYSAVIQPRKVAPAINRIPPGGTMTPALPKTPAPATLEDILAPHVGITIVGGSYRCTCLHTYEPVLLTPDTSAGLDPERPTGIKTPDPEQRQVIDALHTQHQVERLIAAGVEQPRAGDPRAALRQRMARP